MKKKTKGVAVLLCFLLFAAMAIGSGSTGSGNKKDIVASEGAEETENGEADGETDADGETEVPVWASKAPISKTPP